MTRQLPPLLAMGGGKLLSISLILLKLPFHLLTLLLFNLVNLVAPGLVLKTVKKMTNKSNFDDSSSKFKWSSMESSTDIAFFMSLDRVKQQTSIEIRDVLKEAQVGEAAPNPELVDLDTRTKVPLLTFARAGRPLVLNFGSCT